LQENESTWKPTSYGQPLEEKKIETHSGFSFQV
jgi:hypothetical protein